MPPLRWKIFQIAPVAGLLVAGCMTARPNFVFERIDGRRISADPALDRQFQADFTACQGRTNQTMLQSPAGRYAEDALMAVMEGCMGERGYIKRPRA